MKKLTTRIAAMSFVFALGYGAANAQSLKVATGADKGTYSTMFRELRNMCQTPTFTLTELATNGSVDNIDAMVGNQANGALVQSDVLFYRSQTENLTRIKTLVTLHPEEVHVVAPVVSKRTEGGFAGFGKKPIVLDHVTDLKELVVGAVGGSVVTANVIRLQAEIPYTVKEYSNQASLVKGLNSGDVDAAFMVGGAPLQSVIDLGSGFKLLSFPEATVNKLKAVYRPEKLNYTALKARGVSTVKVDALFVVLDYSKVESQVQALATLRSCAITQIGVLKETLGVHPKWQAVDTDNRGKWPYYELPQAKAQPQHVAVTPKKK